uniref:Uncharacterized protein n=1 Tax=Arundo donax TaxID=35708 RepID=A0A0A9BTB0_ARUDO
MNLVPSSFIFVLLPPFVFLLSINTRQNLGEPLKERDHKEQIIIE